MKEDAGTEISEEKRTAAEEAINEGELAVQG